MARDRLACRRQHGAAIPAYRADERAHQPVVSPAMTTDPAGPRDALGRVRAVIVDLQLSAALVRQPRPTRPVDADGAPFDVRRPLHRQAHRDASDDTHENELM